MARLIKDAVRLFAAVEQALQSKPGPIPIFEIMQYSSVKEIDPTRASVESVLGSLRRVNPPKVRRNTAPPGYGRGVKYVFEWLGDRPDKVTLPVKTSEPPVEVEIPKPPEGLRPEIRVEGDTITIEHPLVRVIVHLK
jgi:hypothetical protein